MALNSALGTPHSALRLVVGLGNPGTRYAGTRHNVGYDVIDALAGDAPERVRLFKPESVFMNESGRPVAELARRNGIAPSSILVVCDDFALPLGSMRLRLKGSSGGHNGLNSILEALGTNEIPRLRVGIGPVPEGRDPADFVLERFRAGERDAVTRSIERAAEAVRCIGKEGWDAAMNRYNAAPEDRP